MLEEPPTDSHELPMTVRMRQDSDELYTGIGVAIEHLDSSDPSHSLTPTNFKSSLKAGMNNISRLTSGLDGKPDRFCIVVRVLGNFDWGNIANCPRITLTFDEGWQANEYPMIALKPSEDIKDLKKLSRNTDVIGRLQMETFTHREKQRGVLLKGSLNDDREGSDRDEGIPEDDGLRGR